MNQPALIALPPPRIPSPSWAEVCRTAGRHCRTQPTQHDNWYFQQRQNPAVARWFTWEAIVAAGHSYLCGSSLSRAQYLARYTSTLPPWMQAVAAWCWHHPQRKLVIDHGHGRGRRTWVFAWRGEYVEIGLPHHDAGGERHWVTRDCCTRLLVNVD